MRRVVVSLYLLIFLTACSPSTPAQTPEPAKPATQTPVVLATKSPLPTNTPTPAETETPMASPTVLMDHPQAQEPWRATSPDGQYIIDVYDYYGQDDLSRPMFEILDYNENLLWQVPYQGEMPAGVTNASINMLSWSINNPKLYFYSMFPGESQDHAFWYDGIDLSTLDVTTGKVQPAVQGKGAMSFAFSPDDSRIAYTLWDEDQKKIYVRDIAAGTDTGVVVTPGDQEIQSVGDIRWSPSGKILAFRTEGVGKDQVVEVQTITLDLETLQQKVIEKNAIHTTQLDNWVNEHTLRFQDAQGNAFLLDIFTGEKTILSTPTPEG